MNEPLTRKTIKTLSVNVGWIGIEGHSKIRPYELPAVEFFKRLKDGGDVSVTFYSLLLLENYRDAYSEEKALESYEYRINKVAEQSRAGLPDSFSVPAKLNANGVFELMDGHHRVAQVIANGGTHVTIDVKAVSPAWQKLNDALAGIYPKRSLYQAIDHPWFDDWPIHRGYDRTQAIIDTVKATGIQARNSLDLGCCTGGVCRAFNNIGFNAYGIDRDENTIFVGDYLNMVFDNDTCLLVSDKLNETVCGLGQTKTNVVTCLSVMHHFLWENRAADFETLLSDIADNSRLFFIDHVSGADMNMVKTNEIPLDSGEFGAWMKSRVGVKYIHQIGMFGNRPLYVGSNEIDVESIMEGASQ